MNKILKWDADVKPVAHTRFIRRFCTQNTAQLYHPIIFGRKRSFLPKRAKKLVLVAFVT